MFDRLESKVEEEIKIRMRDMQRQEWNKELERSTFAKEIKMIIGKEKGIYEREEVEKLKKGLEIMATFRMGSETKACKYWKEGKKRICRICGEKRRT